MIIRGLVIQAVRDRLSPLRETTLNSRFPIAATGPIDVQDQGQSVIETGAIERRYQLHLDIEAAVGAADDDAASLARDQLYRDVVHAIFADPPLLGLSFVEDIEEGDLAPLAPESASAAVLGFTLGIEIQFISRNTDPGVAP